MHSAPPSAGWRQALLVPCASAAALSRPPPAPSGSGPPRPGSPPAASWPARAGGKSGARPHAPGQSAPPGTSPAQRCRRWRLSAAPAGLQSMLHTIMGFTTVECWMMRDSMMAWGCAVVRGSVERHLWAQGTWTDSSWHRALPCAGDTAASACRSASLQQWPARMPCSTPWPCQLPMLCSWSREPGGGNRCQASGRDGVRGAALGSARTPVSWSQDRC